MNAAELIEQELEREVKACNDYLVQAYMLDIMDKLELCNNMELPFTHGFYS